MPYKLAGSTPLLPPKVSVSARASCRSQRRNRPTEEREVEAAKAKSDGENPAALVLLSLREAYRPRGLPANRRAFRIGSRRGSHRRNRTDVNAAALRGIEVRDARRPPRLRAGPDLRGGQGVAGRGAERHRARGRRVGTGNDRAVLHRVGEIRLFGSHEVTKVRLHRGDVRLLLRVRVLRDR